MEHVRQGLHLRRLARSLALLVLGLLFLTLAVYLSDSERAPVGRLAMAQPAAPQIDPLEPTRALDTHGGLPFRVTASTSVDEVRRGDHPPVDEAPVLNVEPFVPRPELPDVPATAPLPSYGVVIPVDGVTAAELVDSFSEARGSSRRHLAIDILAPTGTPVLAAAAGTVLRLHTSSRGGIALYLLDHDERYVYYYAHLSAYSEGLREGQRVEAGQTIGLVGHTGNAHESNPHLHFAIWKQSPGGRGWGGRPVNPFLALTR